METINDAANSGEIEPLATGDMEGRKSGYSWMKCMMGCEIDESKQVTKLDCLHFLCSDKCIEKLKSNTKPGLKFKCTKCSRIIPPEQLLVKIVPGELFPKKKTAEDVEITCEYCVFNNPAVAYCPTCPTSLCVDCKELHPQIRKTADHKLEDDLTSLKMQKFPNVLKDESKCKIHGKPGDMFCEVCKLTICDLCLPDHGEHKTILVKTMRETLRSRIDHARRLAEQYGKAAVEIEKKRFEIFTTEWNNMMKMIGDSFAVLLPELQEREKKFKEEVRKDYIKQQGKLCLKKNLAALNKVYNEGFVEVGEEIIRDGEDMASVKFWMEYEHFFKDVEHTFENFTADYDRYVEKDEHFVLNEEGLSEAKEFLAKFGQVMYNFRPEDDDQQSESELQIVNVVSVGSTETVKQSTWGSDPAAEASLNGNVIESQHDNMASSSSKSTREKEIVGSDESLKEVELNESLGEDSIKTGEPAVENEMEKVAVRCGGLGSTDKGGGDEGIWCRIRTKGFRTRKFAVTSTGCAQVTARSVKRACSTKGHLMKGKGDIVMLGLPSVVVVNMGQREEMLNPSSNHDNQINNESEKEEAVSNDQDTMVAVLDGDVQMEGVSIGEDRMEAVFNGGDEMEPVSNGGDEMEVVSAGEDRMEAVSAVENQMEALSNGDDPIEAEKLLSGRCNANATEISAQEQGRGKRQRKKKENPNYIYTTKRKTPRRSKESFPETTEPPIATTGESCGSKNSQLLLIENYDLQEEDDDLNQEIIQKVAALQASKNSNPETKIGQDKNNGRDKNNGQDKKNGQDGNSL